MVVVVVVAKIRGGIETLVGERSRHDHLRGGGVGHNGVGGGVLVVCLVFREGLPIDCEK